MDTQTSKDRIFDLVLGTSDGILPGRACTGYKVEITDTSMICQNDKLDVKKEIPFSSFQAAEFGIGNGLLYLQCIVDGKPFVFSATRRNWKKPAARLLLEKIREHVEIVGQKEYDGYTGWLIWLYMWK